MSEQKILPFYMTYPLPVYVREEDTILKDLEYLQQLYPADAKKYQKKIGSVLNKIDYESSMIYDEYPCRWQLYRLAESVITILKQEAKEAGEEIPDEKWAWIEDMVQILLYFEICKRRHNREKRGKQLRF